VFSLLSIFTNKMFYDFFIYSMRAMFLTPLIALDFILLISFGDK
jgi:hypothetical protein